MAIDTRQKRTCAFGHSLPFLRPLPDPDGSDAEDEEERAHLVMQYCGIVTVPPTPSEVTTQARIVRVGGLMSR